MVMAISRDISERKKREALVLKLLREKELILKEVHHRIKNNMNMMISLLSLQAEGIREPGAAEILRKAQSRMESMKVLYDKLYRSENLEAISLREYLPSLVEDIAGLFPEAGEVEFFTEAADILLPVEILAPLGVIVNELVTNALKHAFPDGTGSIEVRAVRAEEGVVLTIRDSGIGIPESVIAGTPEGLGLTLVYGLADQIDGTVSIERDGGTEIRIGFGA